MNITREIIIPRVRCPHCGAEGRRCYRSRRLAGGDVRRYCECSTCGGKYHVIITDDLLSVDVTAGIVRKADI